MLAKVVLHGLCTVEDGGKGDLSDRMLSRSGEAPVHRFTYLHQSAKCTNKELGERDSRERDCSP